MTAETKKITDLLRQIADRMDAGETLADVHVDMAEASAAIDDKAISETPEDELNQAVALNAKMRVIELNKVVKSAEMIGLDVRMKIVGKSETEQSGKSGQIVIEIFEPL